jgi:hypothetical protein
VTRVLYASFVVALGALAACGRPDAQPPQASRPDSVPAAPVLTPSDAAAALEARIEARRGSLVRKPGSTVAGDAVSQWTAFYAGETLLLIDDSVSLGAYGGSRVRFYFDEGRLRLYREEGRRTNSGPGEREARAISTRIVFDDAGAVAASTYQVDGRDATLPDAKIEEARIRSTDLLRRLVLSR